jgi:purine nucleosidase
MFSGAHLAKAACLLLLWGTADAQRKIFVDTDAHLDCDDAGALAMLHAMEAKGEISLIGMVHNGAVQGGAGGKAKPIPQDYFILLQNMSFTLFLPTGTLPAIDAINTFYGRPDIPVGAYKGAYLRDDPGWPNQNYIDPISLNYPNSGGRNYSNYPNAVDVYRSVLYAQPDRSVHIVSIGFLPNLEDLMRSPADSAIPMTGMDLIRRKVATLSVMGGAYPSSPEIMDGCEFNFCWVDKQGISTGPTTKYVVDNWPRESQVVFCGFEYGILVETGGRLSYMTSKYNPVREAYLIYQQGPNRPRPSFDQITALFGARGYEAVSPYFNIVKQGRNYVENNGVNYWRTDYDTPQHWYVVDNGSILALTAEVNALMEWMPPHPPSSPGGYMLSNSASRKCLDVYNPSGNINIPDNTNVMTYSCLGTSNQRFDLVNGVLRNPPTGKCVDLNFSEARNVVLYSCHGGENQKWEWRGSTVVNPSSGLCLEDSSGNVRANTCNGASNQNWL